MASKTNFIKLQQRGNFYVFYKKLRLTKSLAEKLKTCPRSKIVVLLGGPRPIEAEIQASLYGNFAYVLDQEYETLL